MKSTKNSRKRSLIKLTLILLFAGSYTLHSSAQTAAYYAYDASGNRTKRKLGVAPRENKTSQQDSLTIVKNGISVYPNPANDHVNVSVQSASQNKKATATLMDNTGRVLFVQEVNSSDPFSFDLSNYNPGTYFMDVMIDKERLSYQVIKGY